MSGLQLTLLEIGLVASITYSWAKYIIQLDPTAPFWIYAVAWVSQPIMIIGLLSTIFI